MREKESKPRTSNTSHFIKRYLHIMAAIMLIMTGIIVQAKPAMAASYSGDYRYWSQGSSDYRGMREVGCLITAQAKMLYEANVERGASFNPDAWYNWLLANGKIASSTNLNMLDHGAPAIYASSIGKDLTYLGYWTASDDQLWFNINHGYYTIVNVSGHFVMIDNATSLRTGQLYIYDSFTGYASNDYRTGYNPGPRLLSNYSTRPGGHVYVGNNTTHVHSYTSSVTKEATCTEKGVRTYSCSCGSSYTEEIAAKGHSYTTKSVVPTISEKGYTLYTCATCGHSYKDNYVDSPALNEDGWYYGCVLPDNVNADEYVIEYNNYYEKIQKDSPGADWTNAGVVRNEWQNSGGTYTSESDLATSDSRVLVRSVYYHFCGPNAGNEGNYEQTDKFVHYDEIVASSVIPTYCGVDNGHPYYVLDWADGSGRVWCQSGVTCDGSYGSHGTRCKAWYKTNVYQDRVKIEQYKFTRYSGWLKAKDTTATSVQIRFKEIESKCTHSDSSKLEIRDKVAATCTVEGYTGDTYCLLCGELVEKGETTEKTSHKWMDIYTVDAEPTETSTGSKSIYCAECGARKEGSTVEIPMLTPTPSPLQAGTIVNDAGGIYKVTSVTDSGTATVQYVKPVNKAKSYVVIPDTISYSGITCKVTSIAANAFKNNTYMTKLNIGKNVKYIGSRAFYRCTKLKAIKIKTTKLTTQTVGSKAFGSLYSKVKIKVPASRRRTYTKLLRAKGVGSKAKIY